MQININANDVTRFLKDASFVTAKYGNNSALSRIKISTIDSDTVCFELSSDIAYAKLMVNCEVFELGECLVNTSKFTSLMCSFAGSIRLEKSNNELNIQQGDIKVKLPLIRQDQWCGLHISDDLRLYANIDGSQLTQAVAVTSPFVTPKTSTVAGGVCLDIKKEGIKLLGCNNAAMAMYYMANEVECKDDLRTTLEVDVIRNIAKLFNNKKTSIYANEHIVKFECDEYMVVTRTIKGDYPPIEKLITNKQKTRIDIMRKTLEESLRRLLILSDKLNKRITLEISSSGLQISYSNSYMDLIKFEVLEGDNCRVAFNYDYIDNVVRLINTNRLKLTITPSDQLCIKDKNVSILVSPLS